MWELVHKCWVLKNLCFWIVVLEKSLGSPLDSKGIKLINPKGNQAWKGWSWSFSTSSTWGEEPTHWKRLWGWERLKQKKEWMTGWNGWTASPTQWTSLSKHGEIVKDREVWHAAVLGVTTTWSNNTISGHISRDKHGSKGYMHPSVLWSTVIIVKSWKQPKCPSTNELIW